MRQLGLSWSLVSSGLVVLALAACGSEDTSEGIIGRGLVINEASATNTGYWHSEDDFGETDDWIELYNGERHEVRLGGLFLSDDPNDTMTSELPDDLVIAPKDVLLLWADGQPQQGATHLGFKLTNKDGASVFLSAPSGKLIDSITLQETTEEESFARIPDGTGAVQRCQLPTPGTKNGCWAGDLGDTVGSGGSDGEGEDEG